MITCGTQIVSGAPVNGGGGGASLPDDPAAVLLDAAHAGKAVGLAPGTGEGAAVAFGDLVSAGVGEATVAAAAGDFLVGNGTGDAQLASAAASAVRGVIGPTVPTSGALHHWRLAGSGPWTDLGSGASTLSATGSWETDQPGVSIWRGGVAITSPSSGDRLSASTTIASGTSLSLAVTVGARSDNSSTWSSVRMLVMAWNGSTATRNLLAILTSAGAVYASSGVAGSSANTGNVAVDWSRPHRLVVTHNQSTGAVVFYMDGVQVGTATDSGSRAALNEITIGGVVGNGFGVATALAAMGDAQVWTSALTATQVLADYYAARGAMGR